MLDPRIYRTGLIAVAMAVIVFAFSLVDQQGPLAPALAPAAFSGQHAQAAMGTLAKRFPDRRPGSPGDNALASYIAGQLQADQFAVSTPTFTARTVNGTQALENVIGVRAGPDAGSIVVVAHRDALGSPAEADLSGTAVLLELAHVLQGATQHHTLVLASTSGSAGAAGAAQLVQQVPGPVDAVIVLGDLASAKLRQPILVPWSNRQVLAPPVLRNTVAAALGQQAQLQPGPTSLASQFAHLAFPLTLSEQAPFVAAGDPAVLVSATGERAPGANEPIDRTGGRIMGLGQTVLQTVTALDASPSIPAPSAYLSFDGKMIPAWALKVLVLALILPILMVTVDGVARVRRHGHSVLRGIAWVLSAALPFVLAALLVLGARLVGLISVAPPGPVGPGAVPLHSSGIVVLVVLALEIVLGFALIRPVLVRRTGPEWTPDGMDPGASAGLLVVLCAVSLAIWAANPFAAALLVPALHLWIWIVAPELRLRGALSAVLLLVGLALPVLAVLYYALALGLGPVGAAWNGVLLLAGGDVSLLVALEWSVVVGCAVSLGVIAARIARQPRAKGAPVTVRGPATYAGPGSLGGTESALRR
jgi:hypothetical protein